MGWPTSCKAGVAICFVAAGTLCVCPTAIWLWVCCLCNNNDAASCAVEFHALFNTFQDLLAKVSVRNIVLIAECWACMSAV